MILDHSLQLEQKLQEVVIWPPANWALVDKYNLPIDQRRARDGLIKGFFQVAAMLHLLMKHLNAIKYAINCGTNNKTYSDKLVWEVMKWNFF